MATESSLSLPMPYFTEPSFCMKQSHPPVPQCTLSLQFTFAQIIRSHKVCLGWPWSDSLPGFIFRVAAPAQQYIPLALVFQTFSIGIITSLGSYKRGDKINKSPVFPIATSPSHHKQITCFGIADATGLFEDVSGRQRILHKQSCVGHH